MELKTIENYIDSPNPQQRMKAITELRNYDSSLVVPLLRRRMNDKEFVIRSMVAMGFGAKQTDEAYELLVNLIEHDPDPNVRAEAANSLIKYGDRAIPNVVSLFQKDTNWLIRHGVLAVLDGKTYPRTLFQLCKIAIDDQNVVVRQVAIESLAELVGTTQHAAALDLLITLASSAEVAIRSQVAYTLRYFDDPRAKAVLIDLREDSDYRVIAAILEGLLSE